ncbi:MAG: tyrosine-protein phosphatase [Oscillospiraceae bacterium]|nr:tyrosine-protein phosphatase [Oscillospiraceae bacterium]
MMNCQRRILLQNANNFRDLGGYPTRQGYTTCWGKLFRTECLRYLTPSDWEKLESLGIKTLIDLRGESEAKQRPVNPPEFFEYVNLPFINLQHFAAEKKQDDSMTISLVMQYSNIYENSPEQIARVFNKILCGIKKGAVAFFCTGGKDRTGMTAATLLTLCGVSDDDIISDYMVTEIYNSNFDHGIYRKLKEESSTLSQNMDHSRELLQSRAETMVQFLNYLRGMDLHKFLNDHGFSYESQAELVRRMVE